MAHVGQELRLEPDRLQSHIAGASDGVFGLALGGDVLHGALKIKHRSRGIPDHPRLGGCEDHGAVNAADLRLKIAHRLIREKGFDQPVPAGGVDIQLVPDIAHLAHECSGCFVTVDPGEGRIDAQEPSVGGGLEDALAGVLEDAAVFFLRGAQLLFRAFEGADVLQSRPHPAHFPVGIGDEFVAHQHRHSGAVFAFENALSGLKPHLARDAERNDVVPQLFDDEIPHRASHHLLRRVAQHGQLRGIDPGQPFFIVQLVVGHGRVVKKIAELGLALPENALRSFLIGDIHPDPSDELAPGGGFHGEPQKQPFGGFTIPDRNHLHHPHGVAGGKDHPFPLRHDLRRPGGKPVGVGLPQQIALEVHSKLLLERSVDVNVAPGIVLDKGHGRAVFHERLETLFALPQSRLRTLAVSQIPPHSEQNRASLQSHRSQNHFHRIRLSVHPLEEPLKTALPVILGGLAMLASPIQRGNPVGLKLRGEAEKGNGQQGELIGKTQELDGRPVAVNHAVLIKEQMRFSRLLENHAELLLRPPQRGDVAGHDQESLQGTLGAGQRQNLHIPPAGSAL